jgi:hypothetical protein
MDVYVKDEKLLKIKSVINTVFRPKNYQKNNKMPRPSLVFWLT